MSNPLGGGSDSQQTTNATASNSTSVVVNSTNQVTVDTSSIGAALDKLAGVIGDGQGLTSQVVNQLGQVVAGSLQAQAAEVAVAQAANATQSAALQASTRVQIAIAVIGLFAALIAAHVFTKSKGRKHG